MALIYITGAPGSGKTTLQRILSERGYEAHDLDDYGGPYNKNTDKSVVMPTAEDRSPEWFEAHEWQKNQVTNLLTIELLKNLKTLLKKSSKKIFNILSSVYLFDLARKVIFNCDKPFEGIFTKNCTIAIRFIIKFINCSISTNCIMKTMK